MIVHKLTLTLLLAITASGEPSTPDLTYNCKLMPEVCTNICWAMRCASPNFPNILHWDGPSPKVEDERRISSGCSPFGHRCKRAKGLGYIGPPFVTCNGYPFWTTRENGESPGRQVTRCVRMSCNAKSARFLRQVIKVWRDKGIKSHSLQLALSNPNIKHVNYCMNQPCKNDGFQMQEGMAKMSMNEEEFGKPPNFKFYKLASGLVVASMQELAFGQNFTHMAMEEGEPVPDPSYKKEGEMEDRDGVEEEEDDDQEGDSIGYRLQHDSMVREISAESLLSSSIHGS